MIDIIADNFDYLWLIDQVDNLTDEKISLEVSQWAEENRYMPPELTSRPGFWDNSYTPYWIEPMNCLSVNSEVRKLAIMKAAQVGATTAIIENDLGYTIEHDPCGYMYVSADKALVKMAIEVKVDRMLESCGLQDRIRPADEKSRKTGDTTDKKDFPGGFLLPVGAQNPGKLRQMSVKKIRLDELDGMPDKLGDEGDPVKLAENRTKAFDLTRSIVYLSTPLVMQTSKIYKQYKRGDQRKYEVPCKYCGEFQELEFQGKTEDGEAYGILFDVSEQGILIEESVRYLCKYCFAAWYDFDKAWFLSRGKWVATADPQERNFRSYHISALYSPPGMFSWISMVYEWLEAWDIKADRAKDLEALRTFYNTCLGLPWEERGEAPKFERIIQHRRPIYTRNEIPNKAAKKETGGPIFLLTAAADVHKKWIGVEVMGWAKDGRSYSVDWRELEGDTEILSGPGSPWDQLRDMIERETWRADDKKLYAIQTTFIDARYRTDTVYQFAADYSSGVYPVMGRDTPPRTARLREFAEYTSKAGTIAFNINVTLYKDRLAAWLRRDWNPPERQPLGFCNYPHDYPDSYFRQYEAEYKTEIRSKKTNKFLGYWWTQIPNKPAHAWDCRIYNMAALDLIVFTVCREEFEIDGINYHQFWKWAAEFEPYYSK